jgi:hypothetical protein
VIIALHAAFQPETGVASKLAILGFRIYTE